MKSTDKNHVKNNDICDDMFTPKELDNLYGTHFTIHDDLPATYRTPEQEPDDAYYDALANENAGISCLDDKYDHDIDCLM